MRAQSDGRGQTRRRGRILARGALGVGLLLLALLGGLQLVSERILARRYAIAPEQLALPDGPEAARESVARGRHIAVVLAQCPFCHGSDLGGREIADDPWVGRIDAPNLTRGEGGLGDRYTRADWVRAIRFGVRPDGRSLLLMPSAHLRRMSDRDLASLIAYLEQLPPVDRERASTRVGILARVALVLGRAEGLISADARVAVHDAIPFANPASATPEYGGYLADIGGCRVCHHADLRGGLHPLAIPGEPVPPDLRIGGALEGWSREDFARAMREGRTPDGRRLDREFMPWPFYAGLSEQEIDAIWRYLRSRRT